MNPSNTHLIEFEKESSSVKIISNTFNYEDMESA